MDRIIPEGSWLNTTAKTIQGLLLIIGILVVSLAVLALPSSRQTIALRIIDSLSGLAMRLHSGCNAEGAMDVHPPELKDPST